MKNFLLNTLLLLGSSALFAQVAVIPLGGEAIGEGGSMSFTLGQIDYIEAKGETGTMAQGVQHPYEIEVILGVEEMNININATVYPNPTSNQITLQITDRDLANMSFKVYDISGKIITENTISQDQTKIDLSQSPVGTYLLNVQVGKKNIKTYKIIKK